MFIIIANEIFSKTELDSGEYAGMMIIEIVTIPGFPTVSEIKATPKDINSEYKKDFSNLLSEIYQKYCIAYNSQKQDVDISLELLWLTEEARNQTYNADIKLYLIFRAIDEDEMELFNILHAIKNISLSTLQLQKYEYRIVDFDLLMSKLNAVRQEEIYALVKEEQIENLQNQILNLCYAFENLPVTDQDLSRLVNSLIEYPNSAVSFQLIPTYYTADEISVIEKTTQMLSTLNRGIYEQNLGNISFSLAEKHAETYRYYALNKDKAIFKFNILIYGTKTAVSNISTRVYGQLNGIDKTSSTKLIKITPEEVRLTENFYPLPWAVNETLMNGYRNTKIWGANSPFKNYFRLPYIITADEASEFFRLPIGNDKVSAGLVVNESGKTRRSYTDSIINGGDIRVGSLKNSSRNDTIGFFLNDLTKHMLVVGTPGSGKTTFSIGLLDRLWKEYKIPFLVIEPAKNEYRALVESIPDIQVFTPGKNSISPFIFNPFIPPKNVLLESYKSTLKTAFAAAVIMSSPLDKIFQESINNCYSDFRWLDTYTSDNKGEVFNIDDFIKCFQKTFDEIGYVGEAKNIGRAGFVRLNSLIKLFDTYSTIPIEDLLSKPTIIELAAIENNDEKSLIIALLLLNILSYINSNYIGEGSLRNVILLEEAHVLLDSTDSPTNTGEAEPHAVAKTLFKRMLAEIRSYGVGVIIADQSPRKVSADVVGLTNIKLAFRLVESADKEILADSINMQDPQKQRLAKLKPGEAFLYFEKLDEPEEIITEDYRALNDIHITISDEELKSHSLYWGDKKNKLKPYPECKRIVTCPDTCNFESRGLAKEISRRIFNKYFKADTNDFAILKDVYFKMDALIIKELNDEKFTKELSYCVKLHLLRRIKYYTKINLSDRVIKETLDKLK